MGSVAAGKETGNGGQGLGAASWREAGSSTAGQWENGIAQKRVGRILRMHAAIMCVYFLVLLITVAATRNAAVLFMSVPCFVAYALFFYKSGRWSIHFSAWLNHGLTVVFVVAFVVVFGWDCGVQHFIFVMVALVVVIGNDSIKKKAGQVAVLFALRMLLYGYTLVELPLYRISELQSICFQVINSCAIFTALFSCLMLEKRDVWMMERTVEESDRRLQRYNDEDPLTGLMNRRSMMAYLELLAGEENEEAKDSGARVEKMPTRLSIAVGDVDFFSKVNDRFGHDCGDIVLKLLAYQFIQFMEGKGKVARWGGEEFLFVFDNACGEDAYYYLTKLQQQIRTEDFAWKDEVINLTMTYGLMEYSEEKGIDYCIVEAGKKMEMGKESGRNTIIY